jgi:hypothetical protein
MDFITLNNGVKIPALGLGVFQTPPEQTRAAVETALAAGYRHIDTAAAYGNERQVGEAVRSSGLERSEVFLETKTWISDYGYAETLHGFEKSARKLGIDQIDLPILHQAFPSEFEKTLEAYRARKLLTLVIMAAWRSSGCRRQEGPRAGHRAWARGPRRVCVLPRSRGRAPRGAGRVDSLSALRCRAEPSSTRWYESEFGQWEAGYSVGTQEPGGLLWFEQPSSRAGRARG